MFGQLDLGSMKIKKVRVVKRIQLLEIGSCSASQKSRLKPIRYLNKLNLNNILSSLKFKIKFEEATSRFDKFIIYKKN